MHHYHYLHRCYHGPMNPSLVCLPCSLHNSTFTWVYSIWLIFCFLAFRWKKKVDGSHQLMRVCTIWLLYYIKYNLWVFYFFWITLVVPSCLTIRLCFQGIGPPSTHVLSRWMGEQEVWFQITKILLNSLNTALVEKLDSFQRMLYVLQKMWHKHHKCSHTVCNYLNIYFDLILLKDFDQW